MTSEDTGTIAVLDTTGDIKYTWDRKIPAEVEAAQEYFDAMRKKGYIVFKTSCCGFKKEIQNLYKGQTSMLLVKGAESPTLVESFEPGANYIATPPVIGG